jgi:hypothetical protein
MPRPAILTACAALAALCLTRPAASADAPVPVEAGGIKFEVQTIDKSLKVGYAVRVANVNADGKPDIVVCDADRVIWFENPSWKLHTIVDSKAAGIALDNVCIDLYDVDGDGKLDVALGAHWTPADTNGGGSLQWLQQPADDVDKPWKVFPIAKPIPTLHRIYFSDLDGDGTAELLVGPLKGKGSTAKENFTDVGAPLMRYRIPANVASPDAEWKPETLTDTLHVMHNLFPAPDKTWKGIVTASYEGLNVVQPDENAKGKWVVRPIGEGDQSNPKGARGTSEVKRGKLFGGDLQMFATIEPFHGTKVVVYTAPARGAGGLSGEMWPRTVLDETLTGGHSIGCGDFDGDGDDEIVAGWRDGAKTGINLYKATRVAAKDGPAVPADKGTELASPVKWQKFPLDPEQAAEDLWIADLDADGKLDVVACGRKTKDVKIFWNKGKGK